MFRLPLPPRLFLAILPALALLTAHSLRGAPPAADQPTPWEQAALGLFQDAHAGFTAPHAPDRETRFGEAVTLLNLQPKTDSNLDRAAALFTAIAADDATDELGIDSRYYLARISQLHRTTTDNVTALRIYQELAALHSPCVLAQHALVQVALIQLYDPSAPADSLRPLFDRLSAAGATLTVPAAIRDLHLVLGDAALRYHFGDALALDHFLAADRAGITRASTRRDVWIRIGELARLSGRNDLARDYYQRFLSTFLRDSRCLLVRERLAALPPSATTPSPEAAR